jgi:hypothetical protein
MDAVDIARFSKVPAFPLKEFATRPPEFTFVLRHDRLWYHSPATKLLHRVLRRLGATKGPRHPVAMLQDALVRNTIRHIRRELPQATFNVVGLGEPGGTPSGVNDLRSMRMNTDLERDWCRAYARSHAVIGVHGSNMLLPTAHAAGCIEILPHDRHGNMVQDIVVRYRDRMQLFLIRMLDEHASPADVARHAVSMYGAMDNYRTNMCMNIHQRP